MTKKKRFANIEVVPATPDHIEPIAKRMRKADRDEVWAASNKTPSEALWFSYGRSELRMTALMDGKPELMFGVGDLNVLTKAGAPWLLGTKALEKNYIGFLRHSVEWRDHCRERYSVLRNFVDVRNKASVRWLRWLGFELTGPFDMNGHDFYFFEMRSKDV